MSHLRLAPINAVTCTVSKPGPSAVRLTFRCRRSDAPHAGPRTASRRSQDYAWACGVTRHTQASRGSLALSVPEEQQSHHDAGQSHRILAVDDEEVIRILLKEILSDEGYEVATVSDGQEAIEVLERERFDLVMTDLVMPRANGIEVLHTSKRVNPGCPVIVITGYPSVETVVKLMMLGAADYITKPFNIDVVKVTVAKLLARRGGPHDPKDADAPRFDDPGPQAEQAGRDSTPDGQAGATTLQVSARPPLAWTTQIAASLAVLLLAALLLGEAMGIFTQRDSSTGKTALVPQLPPTAASPVPQALKFAQNGSAQPAAAVEDSLTAGAAIRETRDATHEARGLVLPLRQLEAAVGGLSAALAVAALWTARRGRTRLPHDVRPIKHRTEQEWSSWV